MIISHSKKFCYWKIARTGSNTAELCIRMSGVLDLSQDVVTSCHFFPSEHNVPPSESRQSGHTLPSQAIAIGALTQEQYDTYDHYTIVRDPLARWLSAYAFRCQLRPTEILTTEQFLTDHVYENITLKQSAYLTLGRVQTFPFSDYETSIKTIIAAIGGRLDDVPRLEHRKQLGRQRRANLEIKVPASTLKKELLTRYHDDLALAY